MAYTDTDGESVGDWTEAPRTEGLMFLRDRMKRDRVQHGKGFCWRDRDAELALNMLEVDGRSIPVGGTAQPLDVERLARAFMAASVVNEVTEWSPPERYYYDFAERLAAEYARLSESGSPPPTHRNAAGVEFVTVRCPDCYFQHAHRVGESASPTPEPIYDSEGIPMPDSTWDSLRGESGEER